MRMVISHMYESQIQRHCLGSRPAFQCLTVRPGLWPLLIVNFYRTPSPFSHLCFFQWLLYWPESALSNWKSCRIVNKYGKCLGQLGLPNKVPQSGWLKQQNFVSSLFWRLEVWDPGANTVHFWWELSSWLADNCLLTVSLPGERETPAVSLLRRALILLWGPHPPDLL